MPAHAAAPDREARRAVGRLGVPPVFVVGAPRSGTTVVQTILDAHPDVVVGPETHFVKRFLLPRDGEGRPADGPWGQLVEAMLAIPEFADTGLDLEVFRTAALELPPEERRAERLLELLLVMLAERTGARIAGEKTPNHLLHMELLAGLFPGARFVHVIRDPRAVVLSMRALPWSLGSLAADAEMWRRYVSAARRQRAALPAGSLHEIRFEALVADPEGTARGLARFLGIPFVAAMVGPERGMQARVDVEREPWKARARQPLARERADHWRDALSRDDVAAIEAVAWREMRHWGYAPATPLVPLVPRTVLVSLRRTARTMRASVTRSAPHPRSGRRPRRTGAPGARSDAGER